MLEFQKRWQLVNKWGSHEYPRIAAFEQVSLATFDDGHFCYPGSYIAIINLL